MPSTKGKSPSQSDLKKFVAELSGFAVTAEKTLAQIEADMEKNKTLFTVFEDRMIAIRGTADQLGLNRISQIAILGEEIAAKGTNAATRPQIRKCVGSLWDALTTVKYLLEHHTEETSEEQDILINRLTSTLAAFGGGRARVGVDEIEALLKNRS
jgi:hypothetical protein